jgi:hypothetical protein
MTSTTTTTAHDALAAAAKATAAADAAMTTARENVTSSTQKLTDLEAALVAGDATSKADFAKARSAIEQARADVEWSQLQHQAAEAAHSRAADEEASAHRAVTADEYLEEWLSYNDPKRREHVLLAQLQAIVAELIPAIDARQQLHDRLAHEFDSFPPDEKLELQKRLSHEAQSRDSETPLRPIITHGQRAYGRWTVTDVPKAEIAEAVKAGIAAAGQ